MNICVDAQVVLTWLLTKAANVKSKYIQNRIKDVTRLINDLSETYNIPFKYNYVTNSWPLYSNKFEVVLTFKDFVSDIFCTAIDFNNTIMSWLDFKIFWNILWTKKDDKAKQILQ